MLRRSHLLTAAVAGAIVAGGAAGAAASADTPQARAAARSCSDMRQGFYREIRTNMRCRRAKCVIRRFVKTHNIGPGSVVKGRARDCGGRRFRCTSRPTGPEHIRLRCTRGKRFVRMVAGP